MTDIQTTLNALKRPRILVKAAQAGLADFRPRKHLARILREPVPAQAQRLFNTLLENEAALNEQRKSGDASYSAARHVEVLIALMSSAARAVKQAETKLKAV